MTSTHKHSVQSIFPFTAFENEAIEKLRLQFWMYALKQGISPQALTFPTHWLAQYH